MKCCSVFVYIISKVSLLTLFCTLLSTLLYCIMRFGYTLGVVSFCNHECILMPNGMNPSFDWCKLVSASMVLTFDWSKLMSKGRSRLLIDAS